MTTQSTPICQIPPMDEQSKELDQIDPQSQMDGWTNQEEPFMNGRSQQNWAQNTSPNMLGSGDGFSITGFVTKELKEPILVMVSALIVMMGFFNGILERNIPGMLLVDGSMSMVGYIAKAALVGIIFYLVKRFMH